ncbi:MAG: tetratricopeptide repeat protein [Aggregatilineales bacterium]
MRIYRSQSRLTFRRQRRRSGCASILFLLSVIAGTALITWAWLEGRSGLREANAPPGDRMAAAQAAFDRGDLNTAVALARELLVEQPHFPPAVRLLARALVYRSYSDYDRAVDRDSAVEVTTEAVQYQPSNDELLASHAFALAAARRPAASADAARRVLEAKPDHAFARTALALAYGTAGSYELALREAMQAVNAARGTETVDAVRALAIAYSDLGNYAEAARTVERAIALNPRILTLYFERALFALQLGDSDSATVAYYQVLVYDPDNVKARLRLCELSSLLREREAAINYCQEVIRRAPAYAEGWFRLGREYFLQGEFIAAQQHLNRCATLQTMQNVPVAERRFECWYLQGQAAQILGDCDALVATYNEFRAMALSDPRLEQTWTYPPEGPPGCSPLSSGVEPGG